MGRRTTASRKDRPWIGTCRARVIPVLVLALVLSGCHVNVVVPKEEIAKLDGFQAGDWVVLRDSKGESQLFTRATPVTLQTAGVAGPTRKFVAIKVDGEWFRGVAQTGEAVSIRLADLEKVTIRVFSPKDTVENIITVIGVIVGATAIIIVILIILLIVLLIVVIATGGLG